MAETAKLLDVSLLTVTRYIKRGKLVADKAPGRAGAVSVHEASVHAILRQRVELGTETLDARAVARLLRCRERTVQRLVRSNVLTAVPGPGRALCVTRESVAAYAENRRLSMAGVRGDG